MRTVSVLLMGLIVLVSALPARADPPPWAPAHGWHKKHGGKHQSYYVGYSGAEYERDFEIPSGRCNREKVGAVLGGVVGAAVGNQAGDRDDRVIATIVGAAIGALIGARIGRDMDDRDRACFGHALELGATGRSIRWVNEANAVRYELIPGDGSRNGTRVCRSFSLNAAGDAGRVSRRGTACQSRPGIWEIVDR